MRRALPLSVQLLLLFVGLLVGMAVVLTNAAHSSLLANLESDARHHVDLATRTREQTISQLFQLRQQRAEGFLASLQALCGEPLGGGRLGWSDECLRPMIDDFRRSERALGVQLTQRDRRIMRSGQRVSIDTPPPGARARIIRTPEGAVEYVMRAMRGQSELTVQFNHDQVAALFDAPTTFAPHEEIFLAEQGGQFLTPLRHSRATPPQDAVRFLAPCRSGADPFVGPDHRGVATFQSFRPIPVLGDACVGATLAYEETLAPANRLRDALVEHGSWFIIVGIVLSLVAAQWVAAPVRRLADTALRVRAGQFERPIALGGPSEVRALGRAFNAMQNDLAELVAKEQAARRDAEHANQAKDDFLATVSHELRTPLTAVLGWAHMLRSGTVSPERLSHGLEVIERSARAQSQLIDDLLDVSRIASNKLRIAREPVPLRDVVEAAVEGVRPQADAKRIDVQSETVEPALVLGDARRLEQVAANLLWNAVKFTESGGRISVRLRRANQNVILSVADTGIGISSAFLPYVFEWFRQADARSRSQSGLGLGLGIVRHIVQLHGGSVRAESRGTGQGATFTVTLPVYHPARLPVAGARPPAIPAWTAQRLDDTRVLVVEDDDDAREMVKLTLESVGASVEAVASATDARREVLADAPDVLISDIRMPEEDGYSLIRSLRAAGVATPAIALTAYARHEDADEARAAGFQIHLPKPIDAARLVEAVATLSGNVD